jgi:hypothetical protein
MNGVRVMRIPVVMGGFTGPGDAVLVEEGAEFAGAGYVVGFAVGQVGHVVGCACCGGRGPVAEVLGRMYVERARGEAPFFGRVVVVASESGEKAVQEALEGDVVVRARYLVG